MRICTYRYSLSPLNAYGSAVGIGGRFNYGNALDNIDATPFPALYIAANHTVAHREYFGYPPSEKRLLTSQEFALTPNKDIAIVHMSGHVHNVLDLTKIDGSQDFIDIIQKYKI